MAKNCALGKTALNESINHARAIINILDWYGEKKCLKIARKLVRSLHDIKGNKKKVK